MMFQIFGRMKRYRVLVKGRNVLLRDQDSGENQRFGFFTTRFVKAPDPTAAADKALALVAKALAAVEPLNAESDRPSLDVDEIEEVTRMETVSGFSFFPTTPDGN